jgi:signal transduction histidine kinase
LRRIGVPILAYATCIGSIVAIIGYGYRVQIFYGELASFPMAIHTALCFLFMGVALLCIRPEYGGISEIASTFSGGYTGRILIVAALIVPFTLGMAALYGYWRGYYTTELAIGLLVFTLMLALCILIWRNTSELNLRDKQQAAIARSLEDANKSLLRMNAELDSFAYISSHDLQEPLRKIKIFSGMINDPVRKDIDYHEYARKINESADRMSGLINGLLVFSKLNSTNEAFESTDLNYIIRDVLTDYELTIKEKNAVINVSALPVINAIPLQMRQLFFNLIGNALKFNNGEPHISIQALDADPDTIASLSSNGKNKYCKLVIEDNGIGFEQEYADKIFIVFQRLQSQYTGSGIGLAICKKIIENHNGSIKAFSKPGEGTTFEIFIPQ